MQTQIVIRLSILTEIKFKLDTVLFVNDGTHRENKKHRRGNLINPKRGLRQDIGQEIACHFSQDHTMVTKILDFVNKHPK